jgi:two-component system NtrC family sensor kinase
MAAMGRLAAGISHELNQPLTGIKGFAQAVLMDLEKESPFRKDLTKIVAQADRMDAIIKNVRFFARKSDFNMVELDINQIIRDSLMLLSQQLKVHNIRLIQEFGADIPRIQGDPNQLQQAFLNIISNSRDAILGINRPEGGEIRIRTSLSQDKNHVEAIFQDTGCGIPEENLGLIFSPFFTTKSPDKGMGLGSSIVYRIIENHQGQIDFKTKVGEGTTFRIVLPVKQT